MNYGVILAGGKGTRIKKINIPKQYYEINGIPIIIYTLRKMLSIKAFDYIYIAIDNDYYGVVNNYLNKFIDKNSLKKIKIVTGGKERIDTIHNVIEEIKKNDISDNDVIVIHDAVRPFVTERILKDSIEGARKYGACVASVKVSDTMLISTSGEYVEKIPDRNSIYKGQSPDSFNLKKFIELETNLTEEEKKIIVGTSQICTMNNYPIRMIEGDNINFKITSDSDIDLAENIILSSERGGKNEKTM